MTFRVADSIAASSSDPGACVSSRPEEHVAGRVDVVGERERLVDRLDPVRLGVARVVDRDRLAVDEDLARVGRDARRTGRGSGSTCRRHCRRPARRPRRREVDGHTLDGMDAAERDLDVAHLDEGGVGGLAAGPVHCVAIVISCPPALTPAPEVGVEADGGHQDDADDDVLGRRVDAEQDMPDERLHDDRAEDGPRDRPDAARERRAADDRRGDDVSSFWMPRWSPRRSGAPSGRRR